MVLPVNPEMLILARESRGYTQTDLAGITDVRQPAISKYEKGQLRVSVEHLEEISRALDYPLSFFMLRETRTDKNSSGVFHRRKKTVLLSELDRIHAQLNILRIQLKRLLMYANITTELKFPRYSLQDFNDDPKEIARQVRADWSIRSGPIPNVTELIELAGGIIYSMDFGTPKIDAVSQVIPEEISYPLIFLNDLMPSDRQRWTLAHEIGHIVMHSSDDFWLDNRNPSGIEREADIFAQEFLMPEKDIGTSLFSVSISELAKLKPLWGVSMRALIMTAHQLGKISDRHKVDLIFRMKKAHIYDNEPNRLIAETPTVLDGIIDLCGDYHKFTIDDMSQILLMNKEQIKSIYGDGRFQEVSENDYKHSIDRGRLPFKQ